MGNFVRYFCGSLLALGVDYGLTALCIALGGDAYAALLAGVSVGAVTGFLVFTFWVFPTQAGRFSLRRMGGYLAGVGLVYVVRAGCVTVWNNLGFDASLIYVGLIFAYGCSFLSNFLFQKYLVFTAVKH